MEYGFAVDVWAMGVVAFTCFCGCYPFDDELVMQPVTCREFQFADDDNTWVSLRAETQSLIQNALSQSVKRRASAKELYNGFRMELSD